MMKLSLILSFLILCSNPAYAGVVEPKIVNKGGEATLILGKDIKLALKKYDSVFRLLKSRNFRAPVVAAFDANSSELPMALVGDFNADKVKDVVLLGTSQKDGTPKVKAILLVSQKDHFKPMLVESWSSNSYLTWVENSKGVKEIKDWHMYFKPLRDSEKKILKSGGLLNIPKNTQGFKVMNFYGSGHPYYFKNGKVYTFSKTPPKKK